MANLEANTRNNPRTSPEGDVWGGTVVRGHEKHAIISLISQLSIMSMSIKKYVRGHV